VKIPIEERIEPTRYIYADKKGKLHTAIGRYRGENTDWIILDDCSVGAIPKRKLIKREEI